MLIDYNMSIIVGYYVYFSASSSLALEPLFNTFYL